MNRKIQVWSDQIDLITNQIELLCKPLSKSELNWKPSARHWSIGQVLDHLILINESYYPVLKDFRAGTLKLPFISKINFIVNFFGNIILKSVHPDRRKKMKTFPIWEPSQSDVPADIVKKFSRHQDELKELIKASEDLLEKDVVIHSPANKNIVYKLQKAFEIIVTHEERHLNQIWEILEGMKKK